MEEMSMMVATVPVIAPLVINAGYDPVWFGVLIVILIQAALINPPIGMNLFVVHSVRGRGQIMDVVIGALPFFFTMVVMIVLICFFPQIVTWLPSVAR
jgi:TRAP-type C4-dicarboxylate transport system permease large subunit